VHAVPGLVLNGHHPHASESCRIKPTGSTYYPSSAPSGPSLFLTKGSTRPIVGKWHTVHRRRLRPVLGLPDRLDRPKHPTMPGRITRRNCWPSPAGEVGRTALRRTTTRNGPSSTSKVEHRPRQETTRGSCGCSMAHPRPLQAGRPHKGLYQGREGPPSRPTFSAPGPA